MNGHSGSKISNLHVCHVAQSGGVEPGNNLWLSDIFRLVPVRIKRTHYSARLLQVFLKCVIVSCFFLFLNAGTTAQQDQSIEHWQAIVEQNPDDAKSWYNIGVLYESGQGTQKNQTGAYEAYEKAIALGYAPAMYNLGSIYAKQKDYENARLWWEKAAELDLPEAQYNMGMLYEKGWGVNADPKISSRWYQRAAEAAMEKYFQLYQQSRSQRQIKPDANDISLSVVDRLTIIKTASAATTQPAKNPPENQKTADLRLAQVDATSHDSGASSGPQQPPGWDWVYSQPRENYTIQLFATKNPKKTGKFIQQYALSERAQVIQAVVKGTTYYKVILGSFTQWNDAAVEIGTFPQDLRNQRPWVRKFVSLYKEIPADTVVTNDDQAETQQAVNIEKADSVDQNQQQSTNAQTQASVPDEPSSQELAKNGDDPEIFEPLNAQPDDESVMEKSAGQEVAKENEPGKQNGNNRQDSQAASTQSQTAPAAIVEDSSSDSNETPSNDDVFTIYSKKQLASDELSAELKAQLKSGLEAIQAGDHRSGFNELSILAESGLPEAQYRIALLYSQGNGVEQDAVKAFDLMKSASEKGHPYAQLSLADFYINGVGVDANPSLAAYWQQTAADNLKKLENN